MRARIYTLLLLIFAASLLQTTSAEEPNPTSEEALRARLLGHPLYLRPGYLDNTLEFDQYGHLQGHSPQGSYTLNLVEFTKLHLTKHKLELEGSRLGMHFTAQLASEDPTTAFDRVLISTKKKPLRISIDREKGIFPKKHKQKKGAKEDPATAKPEQQNPAQHKAAPVADPSQSNAESPSLTPGTTSSPAHATHLLTEAIDSLFAPSLDQRMLDSMPEFWKLYWQAVAAHSDYSPTDPSVLHQVQVDHKARLITQFEADSNEYAQNAGVAGMALYHTVVLPTGMAGEVAVARPIGFGLDENAVAFIRKAHFEPATKDGKPVSVLLDLVVNFRIFSKRTEVHSTEAAPDPAKKQLPGPYSIPHEIPAGQ